MTNVYIPSEEESVFHGNIEEYVNNLIARKMNMKSYKHYGFFISFAVSHDGNNFEHLCERGCFNNDFKVEWESDGYEGETFIVIYGIFTDEFIAHELESRSWQNRYYGGWLEL